MATSSDVESVIAYLKTKATGATVSEAKAAIGSQLLDDRKLNAYKTWDFILKEGDRLKLTQRGREYSRVSSDGQRTIFASVIREQKPYMLAVEWIFHQGFDAVTNTDIAAHWHEHCREEIGTDNERTILYQVGCFFSIAEAAGLGTYTIGRRGQQTRLSIDKNALGQFIAETGFMESSDVIEEIPEEPSDIKSEDEEKVEAHVPKPESGTPLTKEIKLDSETQQETIKVFISHSKNMEIVDQVKTMIEVSEIDYEVAVEEETTAIPVPEKVLAAMRRCNAAVICVTADEQPKSEDNKFAVNENVLIEIGAAFVLYDKKVVLVWDRRLPIPSNLQGLYRCEFEGNELSWTSGMKLMKAVKNFKSK